MAANAVIFLLSNSTILPVKDILWIGQEEKNDEFLNTIYVNGMCKIIGKKS